MARKTISKFKAKVKLFAEKYPTLETNIESMGLSISYPYIIEGDRPHTRTVGKINTETLKFEDIEWFNK